MYKHLRISVVCQDPHVHLTSGKCIEVFWSFQKTGVKFLVEDSVGGTVGYNRYLNKEIRETSLPLLFLTH